MLWVGCALMWVAFHGLEGESSSPGAIFNTLGKQLRAQTET
jgi:predicted alpha/beta-fold hydrolase